MAILLLVPAWTSVAWAVGLPSTYAGCAHREVNVRWGGTAQVKLSDCHSFGLGVLSRPPSHGTASPASGDPVESYVYHHKGEGPAGGGTDTFVVLDDNSDFITVKVNIQGTGSALSGSPSELPAMSAGTGFSQLLSSTGGTAPYTYQLGTGTLPAGLSLDRGGLLAGTPTQRGAYSFSVRAQDARGQSATRSYGGTVQAAALSVTPNRATGVQGVPLAVRLRAQGGMAPHRLTLEPGATLPVGLVLSDAGVVSGTTAVPPGDYPVTLRVTDGSAGPGSHFELETFTLRVAAPPLVTISAGPAAVSEDGSDKLGFTLSRGVSLDTATVVNLAHAGQLVYAAGRAAAPAILRIPAGVASITFLVDPSPDGTVEPDETTTFTVLPGGGYQVGSPASATGTVVDDDDRP